MGKNNDNDNNNLETIKGNGVLPPTNIKNIISMQAAANNPLAQLLMSKIFDAMLIQSLALIKYNLKDTNNKLSNTNTNNNCDGNMLQGFASCYTNMTPNTSELAPNTKTTSP
jgi:hypothetical protein